MALPPLPFHESNDAPRHPEHRQVDQLHRRFTALLHQLGNNLNCALLINEDLLDMSEADHTKALIRANELLQKHRHQWGPFFEQHPQGKHLAEFYGQFAKSLCKEQKQLRQQLEAMAEQLDEMRQMILTYRAEEDPL